MLLFGFLIAIAGNFLLLFFLFFFFFKKNKIQLLLSELQSSVFFLNQKNESLIIENTKLFDEKDLIEEKLEEVKVEFYQQQSLNAGLNAELILYKDNYSNLLHDNQKLQSNFLELQENFNNQSMDLASLKAQKDTLTANLQILNQSLLPQFKNIANELLNQNSEKFDLYSREKLGLILDPLQDKLKNFYDQFSGFFQNENKEKFSLRESINALVNSNETIKQEASRLGNALKGNRIMLGHWGEIALENILNSSGLRKDQDYFLQFSANSVDESSDVKLKPDVLIKLPDEKYIIIDAKISFFDYQGYEDANTNEEKLSFVKQFVSRLKIHIESLSAKQYHANLGVDTPEFTLMFIPIESWYNIAVKHYPEIYNFAWGKNVAIISPSTLFVVLKTIYYIWKGKIQEQNSAEIANTGGKIYDSLVDFIETLQDIGKSLEKASFSFDKAMSRLYSGRGNLISRAEKMKKLGVRNNKNIPNDLIQSALLKGQSIEVEVQQQKEDSIHNND